jgi:hypothetical protein
MLVAQSEETLKLAVFCHLKKLSEAASTLDLFEVVDKGDTGVC